MAKRFAEAELVIGIDRDGNARAIKSREQTEISFTDGESAYGDIVDITQGIKRTYEAQADPKDVHLSHAVVGMWLFYWINSDGEKVSPLPIEMIQMGDVQRLRASADSFIEADFGRKLPAASRISDDGGADTTAA